MSRFLNRMKAVPVLMGLSLLAACGSSPQVQYFQLRAEPPGTPPSPVSAPVSADSTASAIAGIWALGPVQIPEYLDRDAIVRPSGQAMLRLTPSERWAEPLRDAIPRLLLQDLARLHGSARIWRLPLPPGLSAERQLRVDIQRLDADADAGLRPLLVLQARWTWLDPSGRQPPNVREQRFEVPAGDGGTDALVAAHRAALWALAQAIATH
ncbi:MAG: hypothetical protein CFE41_19215 [Burkholderiales bacterium PBB2]|nr:MAG: hypothetical protein CFE41_19215 [Burkholderiales bacterium PBB2]